MIVLAAILWGLGIAFASGCDLRLLGQGSLRYEALTVGLFVVQGAARGRLPFVSEWPRLSLVLWAATGLILLWVLYLNRKHRAAVVMMLGLALNLFVVLANAGMPVQATAVGLPAAAVNSGFYHQATSADIALVLADVLPSPGGWMLSLGDVLLVVGVSIHLASSSSRQGRPVDQPTS